MPAATAEELTRLEPRRIVVLGGTAVVGEAVEAALGAHAEVVQRLAGPDRYATSAAVSRATFDPVEVVWVASGESFPDALAGGAAAASTRSPLLLVAADRVPDPVREELARLSPDRIIVLGGPAAVGQAVIDDLAEAAGDAAVERIAGTDRFDTAVRVSRAAFPTASQVLVASGADFADALCAAPVAARRSGPVLLVDPEHVPAVVTDELERLRPEVITIAGGTAAVAPAVQEALESLVINER